MTIPLTSFLCDLRGQLSVLKFLSRVGQHSKKSSGGGSIMYSATKIFSLFFANLLRYIKFVILFSFALLGVPCFRRLCVCNFVFCLVGFEISSPYG